MDKHASTPSAKYHLRFLKTSLFFISQIKITFFYYTAVKEDESYEKKKHLRHNSSLNQDECLIFSGLLDT